MTHSTAHDRSQLESLWQSSLALPTPPSNAQPAVSLFTLIRQFGQALLVFLTGDQQLRIWTKSTKQGVVWFAYDPRTDRRIAYCTEDELRTWLESRPLSTP